MKTILMIGKMNDLMKELHSYLNKYFRIQICTDGTQNVLGMLKVVEPDLILISLIGMYDVEALLFNRIRANSPQIPVLTIGTEQERKNFLIFYEGEQFENLIRPLDNSDVFSAICRRLKLSENEVREDGAEAENGKKRVLVVDDNTTTLRSIKKMLEEHYQVTLANSGMKAMTSIGKSRPDLILLDYEMPVCDGKQTLEMIQADEDLKSIPVVFLTGVNDRAHIQAVLTLRPAGYLLKPAVPKTLIETIERVLGDTEEK